MLLVALDTLVEFDAFVGLSSSRRSRPTSTRSTSSASAPPGAAALSFASIAVCLVLLFGEARLRGHANYTRVSQGAPGAPARSLPLGWATVPVLAGLGAVHRDQRRDPDRRDGRLVLDEQPRRTRHREREPPVPLARDAHLARAQRLGGRASPSCSRSRSPFAAVRYRGRAVTLLERATYLSFALPDLVAAIALAYAASHWAGELYGSFGLLVFAEAILFVPFAVVALRATLGQLEPALEDSARSLGAGAASRASGGSPLPLARPGLAAAAVLVFAFSLGDLSTAQVLLPLDRYTLGTEFDATARPSRSRPRRRSPPC